VPEQDPKMIEEYIQILSGTYTCSTPAQKEAPHAVAPGDAEDRPDTQSLSISKSGAPSFTQDQDTQRIFSSNSSQLSSKSHCNPSCGTLGVEASDASEGHRGFSLLCFKVGKNRVLLEQKDQKDVHNDKVMFEQFRSEYRKKRWRYWIRLMKLGKIKFAQVRHYNNNEVTIVLTFQFQLYHKTEDKHGHSICSVGVEEYAKKPWPLCGMPSGCHPKCPDEDHGCGEYYLTPSPSRSPPICEQALMHFFEHPEHRGTSKELSQELPRRRSEFTLAQSSESGWGLHFKEETCWLAVAGIPCTIGLFSLLWFMLNLGHDYKDAAPPAMFTMAIAGTVLTLTKEIVTQNLG
jgi:hypothetical protein